MIQRLSFGRVLSIFRGSDPFDQVPAPYRVAAAGLVLVGVLLFNMWIALQSAQNVFDDQELLRQGLAEEQHIQSIMSDAKDVETGVRGYLITGDPQFLEPYERGRQALREQLDRFEQVAPGLGGDQVSAALLEKFRRDVLSLLEQSQSFVLRREQMFDRVGMETLAPLVWRQKSRMDALRSGAEALSAYRTQTNATLDAAFGKARRSARVSILVPSFISTLLAAFLCYLMIVDVRRRQLLALNNKRLLEQERQARAEAEAASQAKDEFVSTVSHELRTPLQAILGWTQFLSRLVRGKDSPPMMQISTQLQTIERNARSLARMIDDLLDVSRAITGKLTLVTRRIDLAEILRAAIEVARPAATGKSLYLGLEVTDAPLWMIGDADRLRQVVINLVNNAIKFTPAGGAIQVSARRVGSRLELRVQDSGVGILPELLPLIFERYVQGSVSSARQYGGLGLGLAIVKHLVEMHGGQVSVQSAGSGRGAEFTVVLPIQTQQPVEVEITQEALGAPSEEAADPEAETGGGGRRLSARRLLVVDDDADVRLVLTSLLSEEGAEVVSASSAAEAMEQLRSRRMDLILSDVGMPKTDGYELARSIRAIGESATPAAVPLIALSAFSRAEDARRALESGFDLHLAKPVDLEKLIVVLCQYCSIGSSRPPPMEADRRGDHVV